MSRARQCRRLRREVRRLHLFILRLAGRLADASEVLSHLAERRKKRREL